MVDMLNLEKIYVSIASYRDLELGFTIYDMLDKAKNPKRLFISIFDQDESHIDLSGIFKKFGVTSYVHKKVHYSKSNGIGHARSETHKNISPSHKYYLQIDSHMRFDQDWDKDLIKDYEECREMWGKYIFSSYPQAYEYDENREIVKLGEGSGNKLKIVACNKPYVFEAVYDDIVKSYYGEETGYFCGGFAFGYTNLIIPNNKFIYFNGEEQLISVKLFENNTKVVAPYRNYLYHDYDGELRIRNWERNEDWQEKEEKGRKTLHDFFGAIMIKPYGVTMATLDAFFEKFVISKQD